MPDEIELKLTLSERDEHALRNFAQAEGLELGDAIRALISRGIIHAVEQYFGESSPEAAAARHDLKDLTKENDDTCET